VYPLWAEVMQLSVRTQAASQPRNKDQEWHN